MRAVALASLLLLSLVAPASAGAPATLSGFTAWTASASHVAFVATGAAGRHGYLWVQPAGAARPSLLRTAPPVAEEQVDQLAPGPSGSWAALERTRGNTESADRLDVVSSRGGGAAVATAGNGASIPLVLGDGVHLDYLWVTPAGLVQLFAVGPGAHAHRVADLAGVRAPQEAALAGGSLAIRQLDGTVSVFTLAGRPLATIDAKAASLALTRERVVVRTRTRRLAVYGLRGGLVHSWPLAAAGWTAGVATDGRYAVYLGANKAVHAVRLSSGRDRVVARAGAGFYFHGVALTSAGVVVPRSTARTTTLRVVPRATLRKALG